MYRDWHDLTYLVLGSEVQRWAAAVLQNLGIFSTLAEYKPVLAGTIPLDIAVDSSDLDITCEVYDLEQFAELLSASYAHLSGFRIRQKGVRGVMSVVASFEFEGLPVDVFGQPQPVSEQYAYRHMDVEARLLEMGGPEAREEIRRLKREGLKTEPAFAHYFNLPGDPYEVLLSLSMLGDEALRRVVGDRLSEKYN
ncbi:MAG: DUF4269 domain-containing protein [Chloroflexota bacterium]|nr:DUF4269 domain-containing protein [Chloroflexota bacterium]